MFTWEASSSLKKIINPLLTLLKGLLIEEVPSSLRACGRFPLIIQTLWRETTPEDAIPKMESSSEDYPFSGFICGQLMHYVGMGNILSSATPFNRKERVQNQ